MSLGGGKSSSKQQQWSNTQWPSVFLAGATPTVGAPLTREELMAQRPTTTGLFDTSTAQGRLLTQQAQNVGIGAKPTPYTEPGAVTAPTIEAAQGGLGAGNYRRLEDTLYRQQYAPVAAETQRLGLISDRALGSQLAGAGLASSGAGQGLLARQQSERAQQLQQLSGQAATAATAQTLGLQAEETQQNLQRQQQANIANASNVLAGNTATAANYLATMGLNEQQAQNARASFLARAGLGEQDLARMDQQQLASWSTALNAWLQQYAQLIAAGRSSYGQSSSSGFSAGLGIGGSQAPNVGVGT